MTRNNFLARLFRFVLMGSHFLFRRILFCFKYMVTATFIRGRNMKNGDAVLWVLMDDVLHTSRPVHPCWELCVKRFSKMYL